MNISIPLVHQSEFRVFSGSVGFISQTERENCEERIGTRAEWNQGRNVWRKLNIGEGQERGDTVHRPGPSVGAG